MGTTRTCISNHPDRGDISLKGFTSASHGTDFAAYISALESFDRLEQLQELKVLGREYASIRPGAHVLEVGCGFGLETLRLAHLALPGGLVAGCDLSPDFLAEARRRAGAAGVNIAFEQAHVEALPYPDQSFDIVWSERLLIYVPDLRQAASEMRRVLRAGGRLASIEPDISTSTLNLKDRALVRRVMGHEADTDVVHGWLPGQLRGTLTDVGSKISVLRPVWLCSHLDWQRATSRAAVILPQRTGLFPILSCTTGARELRHLLAKTSCLQPWGTSCLPPERRGTQHVV